MSDYKKLHFGICSRSLGFLKTLDHLRLYFDIRYILILEVMYWIVRASLCIFSVSDKCIQSDSSQERESGMRKKKERYYSSILATLFTPPLNTTNTLVYYVMHITCVLACPFGNWVWACLAWQHSLSSFAKTGQKFLAFLKFNNSKALFLCLFIINLNFWRIE